MTNIVIKLYIIKKKTVHIEIGGNVSLFNENPLIIYILNRNGDFFFTSNFT